MKYLDPKNDLTFKKIFGGHPHLLISFLNAMLPLEQDQEIVTIEYVNSELIPELPGFKRSIVDVNCTDKQNRRFIVEMQMYWSSSFKNRMLFNADKAYVKQLKKGRKYKNLCPVYGLSLVNEDFQTSKEMAQTYYHHYKMSHAKYPEDYIKGIELVFIELKKFASLNFRDKRLHVLWLRFLTEINEDTTDVPNELMDEEVIREAVETVEESAFSEAELEYYEKYWDSIRIEQIALEDAREELAKTKQREEEEKKQKEEALLNAHKAQKQKEEERRQKEEALLNAQKAQQQKNEALEKERAAKIALTKKMLKYGEPIEEIIKETGLTLDEIENI